MNSAYRSSGIAIFLFALFYFASFAFSSPIAGFVDGDNPAVSLEHIKQHSNLYFLSGVASAFAAITLAVAVLSIADTTRQTSSTLMMRTTSTFGLFAAAFFFGNGVLHIQAPGTLLYIESLNHDWGLSAYLAVQMAGTQGLASAGIFALSIWAVGLSLVGWRSRWLPRPLAMLGILPAMPWLMGLLGRLELLPDGLWLLYIGSIILGIPLWSAVLGVFLLHWKTTGSTQPTIVFQPAGQMKAFFEETTQLDKLPARTGLVTLFARHGMEIIGPPLTIDKTTRA